METNLSCPGAVGPWDQSTPADVRVQTVPMHAFFLSHPSFISSVGGGRGLAATPGPGTSKARHACAVVDPGSNSEEKRTQQQRPHVPSPFQRPMFFPLSR